MKKYYLLGALAATVVAAEVLQAQPMGLADIKALAKAGVSDEVIISQLRNAQVVYHLSTAEIIDLKESGVSNRVIDFMINTAAAAPQTINAPPPATVVTEAPPPPPPAPRVEEVLPCPGPGYVWIAGCWEWHRGQWIWIRGRWVLPPRPRAVWVVGHWEHRGYDRVWVGGHWR